MRATNSMQSTVTGARPMKARDMQHALPFLNSQQAHRQPVRGRVTLIDRVVVSDRLTLIIAARPTSTGFTGRELPARRWLYLTVC